MTLPHSFAFLAILQATSTRNLHPDGPQAGHVTKIKSDDQFGAHQNVDVHIVVGISIEDV